MTTPVDQRAFLDACVAFAAEFRAHMRMDPSDPVTVDAPAWLVGVGPSWIDEVLAAHHITLLEPTR